MDREKLKKYITEIFGAKWECMWSSQPTFAVYRHNNNKKQFAVIMEITFEKIGISKREKVNLKCDPIILVHCKTKREYISDTI